MWQGIPHQAWPTQSHMGPGLDGVGGWSEGVTKEGYEVSKVVESSGPTGLRFYKLEWKGCDLGEASKMTQVDGSTRECESFDQRPS